MTKKSVEVARARVCGRKRVSEQKHRLRGGKKSTNLQDRHATADQPMSINQCRPKF